MTKGIRINVQAKFVKTITKNLDLYLASLKQKNPDSVYCVVIKNFRVNRFADVFC